MQSLASPTAISAQAGKGKNQASAISSGRSVPAAAAAPMDVDAASGAAAANTAGSKRARATSPPSGDVNDGNAHGAKTASAKRARVVDSNGDELDYKHGAGDDDDGGVGVETKDPAVAVTAAPIMMQSDVTPGTLSVCVCACVHVCMYVCVYVCMSMRALAYGSLTRLVSAAAAPAAIIKSEWEYNEPVIGTDRYAINVEPPAMFYDDSYDVSMLLECVHVIQQIIGNRLRSIAYVRTPRL